jgi:hypothetical protein
MNESKMVIIELTRTSRGFKIKPPVSKPVIKNQESRKSKSKIKQKTFIKAGLNPEENKTNQKKFKNSLSK